MFGFFKKKKKNPYNETKEKETMISKADSEKLLMDTLLNTFNYSSFSDDIRDKVFNNQKPDSEDYGYSVSNPISSSSIDNSEIYLSKLRTIDGDVLHWIRKGSMAYVYPDGTKVMVDQYDLYFLSDLYKEVYICPYSHDTVCVPKGLILSDKPCNEFNGSVAREADKKGISVDTQLMFYPLTHASNIKKQEEIKELQSKLEKDIQDLKQIYPSFDFEKEAANETFLKYTHFIFDIPLSLKQVYEYIHKDELLIKKTSSKIASSNYTFEDYLSFLKKPIMQEQARNMYSLSRLDNISDKELTNIVHKQIDSFEYKIKMWEIEQTAKHAVKLSKLYPEFDINESFKNSTFCYLYEKTKKIRISFELTYFDKLFTSTN